MKIFPPINLSYFYAIHNIAQLRKHQWLKEDELRKLQEKKLRKIRSA